MKLGIKGLEITEENTLVNNGALRGITNSNKVSNLEYGGNRSSIVFHRCSFCVRHENACSRQCGKPRRRYSKDYVRLGVKVWIPGSITKSW